MQWLQGAGGKVRVLLIFVSLVYLGLCLAAALEVSLPLHTLMVHFFMLLAVLVLVRQMLLLFFAGLAQESESLPYLADEELPYVSVIIPAFNEEAVIAPALLSLLQLDYPHYEIIVVDDGSSDQTVRNVRQLLNHANPRQIPVRIISHSNAGKANALNTGLIHAVGEFVLCVDSDSRITPDSLRNGLRHFQDQQVGAVAGNVMVANETNVLTRLEQLEYMISQNFVRQALAWFGAVTIVPGPIGLFRRSALAQAGGFREDRQLFAEDVDLSVRLLVLGWRISSEATMQAFTEAPDNVFSLLRQRYRWKRGIYQAMHDNFLALILAPGMRRPLIALFLVVESFLLEMLGFGVTLFMVANIIYFAQVNMLLAWLGILLLLDVLALLLATPFAQFFKWFPLLILQKLSYSYALQAWGVLALFDEWRSTFMSWDKVERLGMLQAGGEA
ncbi:MAG: glycosyltransferase family 2 protein [Thiothrix sp.]|uniref:glycosyltransferase family 2 protein n=1 Tax=Thiothrix sp. TaxID=1032 RepID=UPI002620EFB4|nr:glycosyltransferase family 2 protein [Thiothrix sp.]MDD5393116.1 glycosyltransferase family 2 protein [Thiothrix sp.]